MDNDLCNTTERVAWDKMVGNCGSSLEPVCQPLGVDPDDVDGYDTTTGHDGSSYDERVWVAAKTVELIDGGEPASGALSKAWSEVYEDDGFEEEGEIEVEAEDVETVEDVFEVDDDDDDFLADFDDEDVDDDESDPLDELLDDDE